MLGFRFPTSTPKRVVLAVLSALVLAWLVQLSIELGVEFRLRMLGASVWRRCGRVARVDFQSESNLTDSDLPLVTWIGGLEELRIDETDVHCPSVDQLRLLRHLTYLEVRPNQITPQQLRDLRRAMPNLEIRNAETYREMEDPPPN